MNTKMTALIDKVMDSYNEGTPLSQSICAPLPSRNGVVSILTKLESVIFPGFQQEELLEQEYMQFTVAGRLQCAARDMMREIVKSLNYALTAEDRTASARELRGQAEDLTMEVLNQLPLIRSQVMKDARAAMAGDPAAPSYEEIILSYPGLEAVMVHRIAHQLHIRNIPLIPRMMSEYIHRKTGVDIHPGAQIGESFFIDHATGVVIGETTIIGNHVKLYQGVTLGALSVKKEDANKKRHPTIEDRVTIYAGATILGGNTVVGKGSVVGGNVWITSSIPPGSVVYNKPADYIIRNRYQQDYEI